MRTALRRLRTAEGLSLPETLVTVFLLTVAMAFTLTATTQATRTEAIAERVSVAAGYQQAIMARAQQADYGDLGFYTNDEGAAQLGYTAAAAPIELPLADSGSDQPLLERPVVLGATRPDHARPTGEDELDASTSAFIDDAVRTVSNNDVTYRVTTWVTALAPEGEDDISRAKRVVVQVEWVGGEDPGTVLDGSCEEPVRCSVQSLVRVASGADVDPVSGDTSTSSSDCTSSTPNICQTYVRSGRVLDGAWMATDADQPTQTAPVEFYARTSHVASSMQATWSYDLEKKGTLVNRTESVTLESADGGTRWSGVVPADVDDAKGIIRPGSVEVTFTARVGGSNITQGAPAFWSYTKATGRVDDHITAELSKASQGVDWCASEGTGKQLTLEVGGHSAGMRVGNSPTSARDTVEVLFTVKDGAKVKTTLVDADLRAATPVTEAIGHEVEVEASVDGTWRVSVPPTDDCEVSQTAVVRVTRAVDHTTTAIPLRLPLHADRLAVPKPALTLNQATGDWSVTWDPAEHATSYSVVWTIDGRTTDTWTTSRQLSSGSNHPRLEPGQSISVYVVARATGYEYDESPTVSAIRAPQAPAISATRTADTATFSWTKAEGATAYQAQVTNADGDITGRDGADSRWISLDGTSFMAEK